MEPRERELKLINCDSLRSFPTKLNENFTNFWFPPAETAQRHGPHDRIVMSSRVRLARNVRDAAFPGWAKKPERVKIAGDDPSGGRKPAGDERRVFGGDGQSRRARQTDSGGAPSHQPRARGEKFRQRPGLEPRGKFLRDDQRGGPSADAGAASRTATAAGVGRD